MRNLSALLLALCLTTAAKAWQPPPGGGSDEPTSDTSTGPQSPELGLTAEEAIQAAIEAIDRLDALSDVDAKQATVAEINRYIAHAQEQDPANAWLTYVFGRLYLSVGRLADARDQLLKFAQTREGKNHWRSQRILGDLFVDAWPRLAQRHYEKAAALKPNEPSVLTGLATCAFKLGDFDKAVRCARETVVADGRRNVDYLDRLARMLLERELWEEAQREAAYALELALGEVRDHPDMPGPLRLLHGQYDLMIDLAEARISQHPEAAVNYLDLNRHMSERAQVLLTLSHHERLAMLELGLGRTESQPSPALLVACAIELAQVGRRDEAIATFQRAVALDPDNPTAREWLNRLQATPVPAEPPTAP